MLGLAVRTDFDGQELEATLELSEEGTGLTCADPGFLRQGSKWERGVW